MSRERYTLDDLQIDVFDLHQLIVAACNAVMDMPHERDGERDDGLDHVGSLLRIAREFAERMSRDTDLHYRTICSGARSS